MTYAANPPPYSYFDPNRSYPVEPSAPPAPYYTRGDYAHNGFFGDPTLDQNRLGREMLEAVVVNKTDWALRAKIPPDSLANRAFYWFFKTPTLPQPGNPLDNAARSALYLQTGRLLYAELINDTAVITECTQQRKANVVFQDFLNNLTTEEASAEYCFSAAAELNPNSPEAVFELGKLHFLTHQYDRAVTDFHLAQNLSDNLPNSSSNRKQAFKALTLACAGAANERLGLHDLALFNYLHASKKDPQGASSYQESLSRNFQILCFKQNKSSEELEACMEYDPYDPNFSIELAHHKLNRGDFQEALNLLSKSIDLAYSYKPNALFRCAELVQQFAFAYNNSPLISTRY